MRVASFCIAKNTLQICAKCRRTIAHADGVQLHDAKLTCAVSLLCLLGLLPPGIAQMSGDRGVETVSICRQRGHTVTRQELCRE